MKPIIELFPILCFFFTYFYSDIYTATAVLIITTAIQLTLTWIIYKNVSKYQIYMFLIILVLGSLTLFLKNDMFIKWKVTIINWIMAVVFVVVKKVKNKTVLELLIDNKISLLDQIWNNLNYSWIMFFFMIGTANLYIAYNYSTDVWVYFKLVSAILSVIFTTLQAVYIAISIKSHK